MTHDGSDDKRKQPQPIVGVWVQHACSDLVRLEPTNSADGEDVEPRRKKKREDERSAGARSAEHECEDGEDDGEERRRDRCKLWALAEGCSDQERPTSQSETK